jgi:hypothetical protein
MEKFCKPKTEENKKRKNLLNRKKVKLQIKNYQGESPVFLTNLYTYIDMV